MDALYIEEKEGLMKGLGLGSLRSTVYLIGNNNYSLTILHMLHHHSYANYKHY